MIPVYQKYVGEWGRGDCMWAALASIFEEPLDSFHYDKLLAPCREDLAKLTACRWPHLTFHEDDLCTNYRLIDAPPTENYEWHQRWTYDVPTAWEPPHSGYWIASVRSQSLWYPESSSYFGMRGLHAVVMHGWNMVHDPNPKNKPELTPVCGRVWWTTAAEVPWPT